MPFNSLPTLEWQANKKFIKGAKVIDLQVEYLVLDLGERYPMLVDSGGMPDFYFLNP